MALTITSIFSTSSPTHRGLAKAQDGIGTALERLSTGKRINRAADDPAGLIAARSIESDLVILEKKLANFDQEEAKLGALEGVYSVAEDLAERLNGLVLRAGNRNALGEGELDGIITEVESILDGLNLTFTSGTYKGEQLTPGLSAAKLAGASRETIRTDADGNEVTELSALSLADLPTLLHEGTTKSLELADDLARSAREGLTNRRAGIGTRLNQIDSRRESILVEIENFTGALSEIEDANIAEKAANLVRNQLLEQAALSSILIGRQSADQVLALLDTAVETGENAAQ